MELKQLDNIYSPNYSYVSDLESTYDYRKNIEWMKNNWTQSFYWSLIYLCLVFVGKQIMLNRAAYKLKLALIPWNLFLASFSIMGLLRTLPEIIHVIKTFGFTHSVCLNSYLTEVSVSSLWSWLFVLSKLPELCDTLFIVARKQPLIFLHWYHHIITLVFAWYSYSDLASTGRWYVVMNYMAHSLMYSYYAIKAFEYRVPKSIAMFITLVQMLQMVFGIFVTSYAFLIKTLGKSCAISYSTCYFGITIYISYFLLFAHFFRNSYSLKSTEKKEN